MDNSESARKSVLEGALPVIEKIRRARVELLDLSTRNRLLNTPRNGKAKTIEVVNELAVAMYQTLVLDEKRFTFSPGRLDRDLAEVAEDGGEEAEGDDLLLQPDLELDAQGRAAAHWDGHLTTRMTSAGLQKRLLDLYVDAKTLQEEQGVNILYLAIGYLKWRDANTPQIDRYAPLVLVPVALERSNAGEKFHLRWSGDDIQGNLSLQAMLSKSHGLKLPEIEDFESLDVGKYMDAVQSMVGGKDNWAVLANDAVLGLFSFSKFMMYRDLDPELWHGVGGFEAVATIRGVISDGFPAADQFDENVNVDGLITAQELLHVMDSDSSQSLVIHDARRGGHLLVQGPPGTGKSQTIANIIAAAVADGKKVLFVAEKMAALEVVKRRLDNIDIGVACLELHSNKANKKTLLEELKRTWQLGAPVVNGGDALIEQLTEAREELNQHVLRLHERSLPSQLTPYEVMGHLVRLVRIGQSTSRFALDGPLQWEPHHKDERWGRIQDLAQRVEKMGVPNAHAWFGVGNDRLLPNDRARLIETIGRLTNRLDKWIGFVSEVNRRLELDQPIFFKDISSSISRATALVAAPGIGSESLTSSLWDEPKLPKTVLDGVESAQRMRDILVAFAQTNAAQVDWSACFSAMSELPTSFTQDRELSDVGLIHDTLVRIRSDVNRLAQLFVERAPLTLDSAQHLVAMADRAATIPELQRDALVSQVWDRGIESIVELVDAVEKVQLAKQELQPVFRETAWTTELEEARGHLAAMGGSWLRFLSGAWRRSNRLVNSLCVSLGRTSREEVVRALDQLISAQHAQRRIDERNAQGREAFGSSWDRERSTVEFLRGVVAWMRDLKPLGSNARERLADVADRELAANIGKRVRAALGEIRGRLVPLHEAFIAEQRMPWGEESIAGRIQLVLLQERTAVWKAASEQCRALLREPHSRSVAALTEQISRITQTQSAFRVVDELGDLGQSLFGALWRGLETRPDQMKVAMLWMSENPALRRLASLTPNAAALLKGAEQAFAFASGLVAEFRELFAHLAFKASGTIEGDPEKAAVLDLAARLRRWLDNPEGLPEWVSYLARSNEARRKGLAAIVDGLESGVLAPDVATAAFDLAYYEAVLALMVRGSPELAKFDGVKHSQKVVNFADLDRRRMRQAIGQVLKAHHECLPKMGGAAGPTGVLRAEMARQRKHMPIRQLMHRCAPAIQALKPVFMMSPLSVAQFLPPGIVQFDLLVIDEASQVQPVDALGAIARAKQLVIVGDERQLPPTRFFSRLLGDDRDDDEQGASAADMESILGLCKARGLPERMLRWHYRSRHQSLIAVSNSQFYENKLFIVPSPFNSEAGMGLRLHHRPENVYGRGDTSTNPLEAKQVASAVIDHARATPGLSLGVATFSAQQRRAVLDEVELLRRQHPETEPFFAGRPDEPFFIKSLENIQGDERDVIFIAVGYGRDANRHLTMNFGPLSREGGERRLNVLISRAKRRCEIFSSLTDEDIDLERARGKGVAAFKLFLHYARTGRMVVVSRLAEEASPVIEPQIAETLKSRGYNVHANIGTAGCFVDLAVVDDARPGRYILGIELDGASYRSARSARDRDRLRRSVLEDQGWIIHRIWSSDWFQRPQSELERVVAAIERAKVEIDSQVARSGTHARAVPVDFESVDRGEYVDVSLVSAEPSPSIHSYEEASFTSPHIQQELHQVPSGHMATIIHRVVEIEGPVHRDEVIIRVRSLWGLQRAGGRIQAAVDAGISHAISQRKVELLDDAFLLIPGQEIKVRDRSEVESLSLRRPDYLPPQEVDSAVRITIAENLGAKLDELVVCVSRKFGFRSTGAQLREVIARRVDRMLESGVLEQRGEHIALTVE